MEENQKARLAITQVAARLFSPPTDDRANPWQSAFSMSSAEIWRLAQQRRSQTLVALLSQKRNEAPVNRAVPQTPLESNGARDQKADSRRRAVGDWQKV
jgi:hypothetical protein